MDSSFHNGFLHISLRITKSWVCDGKYQGLSVNVLHLVVLGNI